jgi:[acyl-carrier-protein] S-malonyltransferase
MGELLAEQYPVAARTFQEADDALAFSLSRLCFDGPDELLKLTENTQPALLTVSVAAHRVLNQEGIEASFVAGHSLGEYAALVAAGALAFTDAVQLVRKRGRYMQEAVPAGVGAMAALLKLPVEKLEGVLTDAAQGEIVTAANLNSPDQVVIAGHASAVKRAMELAKAAGAKRAILLPVSAPFHCPLMKPAQERLQSDLERTTFHDPQIPLVSNWSAQIVHTADEARESLLQQIPNPVRWTESIQLLTTSGVRRCIEVGAGSVLTGLCRNIDAAIKAAKFGEPGDLDKVREVVNSN